jgi:molecular chaperone GrpE
MEQEIEKLASEDAQIIDKATDTTTQEMKTLRESLMRSQADYSNLLRRMEREKMSTSALIKEMVVLKILPTVDNLERAMKHIPADIADQTWTKGIRSTLDGLMKQLSGLGVTSYDSIGQRLDHNLHDVMAQAPGISEIVLDEVARGYKLDDKVIRHASVIVGDGSVVEKEEK